MTTSLAQQLKKLATPSSKLLVQKNKKSSLLFDPSDAAAIDRSTFYEIGISGLKELMEINDAFEEFQNSLFDESSKYFERSMESNDVNSRLNSLIERFLFFLSPYFLLKPSQKVLEWLIVRFHIHDYNSDELIFTALPYHGTRLFARLLQVFDLDSNSKWKWLLPLQKKGIPLSKSTLFNHCASDAAFLKILCTFIVDAVEAYGPNASRLTTMYAFYSTTLVGALQSTTDVSELHLTYLLPSLLKGLSSESVDYTASALLIIAVLLTKTSFSSRLHQEFVERITKIRHVSLKKSVIFLLNILYQSENLDKVDVPEKAIGHIVENSDWFVPSLGDFLFSSSFPNIFYLAFVRNCLRLCKSKPENEDEMIMFLRNVLDRCIVDDKSANKLIRIIISECMEIKSGWSRAVMQKLERQYPSVWDDVISSLLQKEERESLCHLLGLTTVITQVEIFGKLNHPNGAVRKETIKYIAENSDCIKVKYVEAGLTARWHDEDPTVIETMFLLPHHLRYFSCSILEKLLLRCWMHSNNEWNSLLLTVIDSLKTDVDVKGNTAKYTVLMLPLLVCSCEQVQESILELELPFMKLVKAKTESKSKLNILKAINEALKTQSVLPSTEVLIDLYKELRSINVFAFTLLLLLSSSYASCDFENRINLLSCVFEKIFPDNFEKLKWKTSVIYDENKLEQYYAKCKQRVPREVVHKFFVSVLQHTPIPKELSSAGWCDFVDDHSNLIASLYEYMNKCGQLNNDHGCNVFISLIVENQLHTLTEQMHFFFNMSAVHKDNNFVSVQSLKMINSLLKNTSESYSWMLDIDHDKIFVPCLLIHLFSEDAYVRKAAMETITVLCLCFESTLSDKITYLELLKRIVEYKEEILIDRGHLQSVIYGFLSQDKDVQALLSISVRFITRKIFDALFDSITDESIPVAVSASILPVVDYLQDASTIYKLIPLAKRLLIRCEHLDLASSIVVHNVIEKFNVSEMSVFEKKEIREFVDFCLQNCSNIILRNEEGVVCLGSVVFRKMSVDLFDAASERLQKQLLDTGLKICAGYGGDHDDLVSAANSFMKKITLNCELILEYIKDMKKVNWSEAKLTDEARPAAWSVGLALLEVLQNKKKMSKCELILPLLFEVLAECCELDDKMSMEYEKQVCLSSVLNCSQKLLYVKSSGGKPSTQLEKLFNVELIVNCIRSSPNPQTHHHALLLLAHCVRFAPHQVLHNVMSIFTFMGSSVLRQDDAFSFQIISNILDTIVPLLVDTKGNEEMQFVSLCNVLKVFAISVPDIPDHRKKPLLVKLMKILNDGEYMHVFVLYAFEEVAKNSNKSNEAKYLEVMMELLLELPIQQTLRCMLQLLKLANSLPHNINENYVKSKKKQSLLDMKTFKNKELHHLKYIMLNFMSSSLSKAEFIYRVSKVELNEIKSLENYFREMIEQSILYLRTISAFNAEPKSGSPKYWKVMNTQTLDILNRTNALLTCETFLLVVKNLIGHKCLTVQRKTMELLNWRLQETKNDILKDEFDSNELMSLIPSLTNVIETVSKHGDTSTDLKLNQQTAAISIKLLVKYHYSPEFANHFKKILLKLSSLIHVNSSHINNHVLACLVLTIAELTAAIKVHSIEALPKFVPQFLRISKSYQNEVVVYNDVLLLSIIVAIQKLVETLPNFLSPYLESILFEIVRISARVPVTGGNNRTLTTNEESKSSSIVHKLKIIRQKLSEIPSRILLPSIATCFNRLCKTKNHDAIELLMNILADSFPKNGNFTADLTSLFLDLLDFRLTIDQVSRENIFEVESYVINTLCAVVLKSSEATFRPFYHKLYDWGVISSKEQRKKNRIITYYRILSCLSEKLKNIFVLFASNFIRNAAELLDRFNAARFHHRNDATDTTEITDSDVVLLIDSILKTLYNVFKYDTVKFLTKDRFDMLIEPLVNQIENVIGDYDRRSKETIIPCVARFAAAVTDDSLWKQFNYSVLLKTRHSSPQIRLAALDTVCAFATHLGDNFLPFLPETVPFLAELLEDENETVEKETHKAVQKLEQVLEEPIQKYF